MTAADKYYLKARDMYPYDMDDALEALEYGLSCDETHAGLITLQGKIYYKDLANYEAAQEQFELALFYDPYFVDAYYEYLEVLSIIGDANRMRKLMDKALKVPCIDKSQVYYKEAMFWEKKGEQAQLIIAMQNAIQVCSGKDCYTFLAEELERIQTKDKSVRTTKSKVNIIITP